MDVSSLYLGMLEIWNLKYEPTNLKVQLCRKYKMILLFCFDDYDKIPFWSAKHY